MLTRSRRSGSGAGGNRTPVRRRRTVRATTIPEMCGFAVATLPGQVGPEGPHRRIFPRCQRSFQLSAVFPCGPSLLLLPGCSDQAPGAVTGPYDSLTPGLNQAARATRWLPCLWLPRLRSLSNSGRTIRLSIHNVETDQPLVKQHPRSQSGRWRHRTNRRQQMSQGSGPP